MLNKKPRRKFKAITFTKIEKKKFKVDYKEESFKDYNSSPYYSQHQYGIGFTYNGGKSNKCRYA